MREAEVSKAWIHEVAGRWGTEEENRNICNELACTILVDNDYQVLGNHLDDSIKKKIVQHEYVDFARLLPRDRVKVENDNRLEMINPNGKTYWVPYSDQDNLAITSYNKWDQAFRIFSSVYTRAHLGRASELLQYHHLIYSATQNYLWDNVYTYDMDFRIHMSNHPDRNWAIILQQTWSFRLKDKLTHFKASLGGSSPAAGPSSSTKSCKICFKFNQGIYQYDQHCKFDHKCVICGKFGHGAINCRRANNGGHNVGGAEHQDQQHNDRYHYYAGKEKQHNQGHRRDGRK